ncbi:MAG TPA: 2-dehydro-3-deoxyphosphogluconate aldolase [Chloroflexi bacterium]|nr:2-dehydro-3-deoxyphosphogluconate aldolase [Chloroflexota bacterium]
MRSTHETVAGIVAQRVIAIVRLTEGRRLVAVAEALTRGGLAVIEFAMTTPGALDAIREARARFGDGLQLGAGTVLDAAMARAAVEAGADFIVTPVLKREIITACRRYGVACLAGAFTPTEILRATEWGADLVKVFPASTLGPGYIRDLLAPLPHLRLVPTGGVTRDTIAAFLAAGAVAAAVGSQLVDRSAVAEDRLEVLTERARQFLAAAGGEG